MKELNEKTDFIINYGLEPTKTEGKKEGDIVPHKKVVKELYGYVMNPQEGSHFKIWFTKDNILSLADQIMRIESESVDCHWDENLPF